MLIGQRNFPLCISYCWENFKSFNVRVYREVIAELKEAGASRIQFDEPTLVLDLDSHQLEAFTKAYSDLESSISGFDVLIETYFADVPAEAYK